MKQVIMLNVYAAVNDGFYKRGWNISKLDCSVARNRKCIPRSP